MHPLGEQSLVQAHGPLHAAGISAESFRFPVLACIDLAIMTIWGEMQRMENISVYETFLSLHNAAFEINK